MATSKRFKRSLHGNHPIISEALRLVQKLGNQIPGIRITPLPKKREDTKLEKIIDPIKLIDTGNTQTCRVTTPNCWQEFRIVSPNPERVRALCNTANERRLAQFAQLLAQLPG